MADRLLALLNCLIAVALGIFLFQMLPYSAAVRCEPLIRASEACQLPGVTAVWLWSLAPAAFVIVLILLAFHLRPRYPRFAMLALLFLPAALFCWVVIAWALSAS